MPLMGDVARGRGVQAWCKAMENARKRRLQPEQMATSLTQLAFRHRPPPADLADILIGLRAKSGQPDDPLIFSYAEYLLKSGYTDISSLLLALLQNSHFSKRGNAEGIYTSLPGMPTFEERIFTLLANFYSNIAIATATKQTHSLAFAVSRWLHTVSAYETGKQLNAGVLHTLDSATQGMYDALGVLAFTIFNHGSFKDVDKHAWWKKRRALVSNELESFDLNVLRWVHSQYAGHLQALAKSGPFLEKDAKGLPVLTDQQVLSSIADLPCTNSRAGLFIWLNASLCARPLADDATMRNYLLIRHPDSMQSVVVDLLLAGFDVLTNAMLRKEPRQSVKIIRSFICNKVPVLLSSFSGHMISAPIETCIQMAFMGISMDPLPLLSAGAPDVRDLLKMTRLDFLQSCALHGLISESTISGILQESVALPRVTRYTKDGLIAQCASNVGRIESLIKDLDGMQGNSGAMVGCIVDVVNSLCANKDTMSLKTVCNALIRKVPNLDIVMQYIQPADLLLPLCALLNDWVHDQDQSEFQPPYEEFASILLLILTAIHRYGLQKADLGLAGGDHFMVKILQSKAQSMSTSKLTEEQNAQLSRWIEGLYATDEHGETTGIGDEVMSHCPPQAFYLLVPTLFEQSVLACKSNSLAVNTLKGGLEFLLEPFLLPSLIGGFSWLAKHSWEDHGDADILLHALDKLLKPSSSSQETQSMHRAILATVAAPLERSLQELLRRRPQKSKQVSSLIDVLKPHVNLQRTLRSSKAEVEAWLSTAEGDTTQAVGKIVRDLTGWAVGGASNPPPNYTHRLLIAAEQLVGAKNVLDALVAELKEQTDVGNGSTALDICTAIVCAPTPDAYLPITRFGSMPAQIRPTTLSLRDTLRLSVSDVQELIDRPSAEAEAVVRLSRKVEIQLSVAQMSLMNMQAVPLHDQSTEQVMKDLGLSADVDDVAMNDMSLVHGVSLDQASGADFNTADLTAALNQPMDLANASGPDFSNIQSAANTMELDQSQDFFGDLNMDLTQPPQQMQGLDGNDLTGGNDQQNQEEDIFAGLDMGENFDDFTYS